MEIPEEVRSFLESLLDDAGIRTLDETTREEMIKELYARLDNYLATVITDHLPDEHLETFITMNEEKKSKEEIEQFLREKVPDAQGIFAKAFADFRQSYLEGVSTKRAV